LISCACFEVFLTESIETTTDEHKHGHFFEERFDRVWDSPLESPCFSNIPLTLGHQRLDLLFVAKLVSILEVVLTNAGNEVTSSFEQSVSFIKTDIWQMRIHEDACCHDKVKLANHISRQLVDPSTKPHLLDTLIPARLLRPLIEVSGDVCAMDVGVAALCQLLAKDARALSDFENQSVTPQVQESEILFVIFILNFLLADGFADSLRICVVN